MRVRNIGRANAAGWIAAQRDDMLYADRAQFVDDIMCFITVCIDTGQMRGCRQVVCEISRSTVANVGRLVVPPAP